MNFELFKKEIDRIKQAKFDAEEKERRELKESYEQAIESLLELLENLRSGIEYATKEFNLFNDVKEISCTIPYVYSASIRWSENFDNAVCLYTGQGTTLTFTVNDLINRKIKVDKDSLQWIADAFCSKNSVFFAGSLLKKLESNTLYVGRQEVMHVDIGNSR